MKFDEIYKKVKADAAETLALLEERNRQVGELTENERRLKCALIGIRLNDSAKRRRRSSNES